jgi:predicted amidophosphoribosyltransferase
MAWRTAPVELLVAYLERLLAAADQGVSGDCRSCGAPHSRGAAHCWKCGQPLMSQATSAALIEPLETS